ncbi:antibiotic biosynthesis monooxygenase domain-containing protein [Pseudomonas sp. M47T1]|uniref:antibiotic biosynthesis monooxygenase family protein n=1 Tax=unclassified Pseudomonas TaxID=196821 RepID=UPI0002607CEF|nr:antibiotic biosynthesis monooxygenase family protein [Pseudomonas sp. M47T1]EIK98141.1 antibiotic biosynthesis monooxygenase domain-containing protein [Pseudomonas sp. M47T1]
MSLSNPVSHCAFIRASAGHSTELGQRLERLLQPSRHTPGCLHFALQHSHCDEHLWLISGFWASEQAMAAWFNSPVMQVFDALVSDRLVTSLDFHTFSDVGERSCSALHKMAS